MDMTPLENNKWICISFLRTTGTDPIQEAIRPVGSTASQVKSIRPSVEYVDD